MKLSLRHTPLIVMAACGFVSGPGAAFAGQKLNAGPLFGIDDYNTVRALAPVATSGSFVETATSNSGFETAAWHWTQASLADSAAVQADTTIDPYVAWVVEQTLITFPNGHSFWSESDDQGGVNVLFQFTPKAGDPLLAISIAAAVNNTGLTQLHWLQVFHESDNLGLNRTIIDNSTPWYDVGGEAGMATLKGSRSWLGDDPTVSENGRDVPDPGAGFPGVEPVDPYMYSIRFETYLAVDSISNRVNNVTLYGGWAWGYDYTASDTPEPSTAWFLCFGVLMIGVLQAARVKRR